jgi:hypothetical protein
LCTTAECVFEKLEAALLIFNGKLSYSLSNPNGLKAASVRRFRQLKPANRLSDRGFGGKQKIRVYSARQRKSEASPRANQRWDHAVRGIRGADFLNRQSNTPRNAWRSPNAGDASAEGFDGATDHFTTGCGGLDPLQRLGSGHKAIAMSDRSVVSHQSADH